MQNPRRMVLVSLWCGLFLVSSTGWAREGSTVVPAPLARGGGASAELMASMTETKLDASGAQPLDYFGGAVSIDGSTAVVGASAGFNPAFNDARGKAYVFSRDQGGAGQWGEVKKLVADDAADGDFFGIAVSMSGDTIAVGSLTDVDDALSPSGAVYLFERNAGGPDNWGQVKKLTNGLHYGNFGHAVAISGDTLVVGARGEGDGAAYVLSRDVGGAGNWGEVQRLTLSDPSPGFDNFGAAVAVDGQTAIVGAFAHDGAGEDAGSAYVFARDAGGADNWGEVKKLVASDAAEFDVFGTSVSIDADTVVVGAPHPIGTTETGAAYVFSRDHGGSGNWGEVGKLTGSTAASDDELGTSVAVSGDLVAVGAINAGGAGGVRLFRRDVGGADAWGEDGELTASDGALGDDFGFVAASSGTVLVGARFDDDDGGNSGSAYVYEQPAPSDTVVYTADQTFDGVFQLYGAPLTGGSVTSLSGAMPSFGDVTAFEISLDGNRAVYSADQTFDGVVEVYSVPLTGGSVTSLVGAMPSFGDVTSFAITPNCSHVVYMADQTFDGVHQVYSVPIAGGSTTSLTGAMPSFGDVSDFAISPDGSRVVYTADQTFDQVVQLYSVPATGGGVTSLSAAMPSFGDVRSFAITPDGSRVVYLADQTFDEVFQVYSVPVTGGGVTSLSAAMPSFGDVTVFAISPDGGRVVYLADQTFDNIFQIYSAPLAGGGVASLSPGMPAFGDVSCFTISADGSRVVYGADQTFDGVVQAYSVPVQGGAGTNLGGAVPSFSDVNALEISPDSETVCGPGPECFLVIGDGPGDASFLDGHHMFETQVDDVEESHAVLLDDIPEFVLPIQGRSDVQIWGGKKGGPPAFVVGDVGDIPAETPSWMLDMSFAVQVLMWNPEVFPELPEQSTAGLQVTLLPNGGVSSTQYGESVGGLDIWHEVDVDESGRRVIRFPFDIPDL